MQLRELERRRGLADQRGRHLAWIQTQADAEERDQYHEQRERNQIAIHASLLNSARNRLSCGGRRGCAFASDQPPITPVAYRQESTERHHDATAPDPDYERLVIDTHAPRAVRHPGGY